MQAFEPKGVIPACLLPFDQDLAIDERAYRSHLEDLLAVEGIAAITTNAHASEVHALSFDEQRRVLALTKETLGDRVATVAGVFTNGSLEAARIARMAQDEGADCLLVFPPDMMAWDAHMRPEMALEHFSPDRRCERPADHPVPVPAGLAADVPVADPAGALPALSPDPRDQGFLRRRQAARAPHPRAPRARSPGQRAEHAQRLADELAGAGLPWPAVGRRQRDRQSAGRPVRGGAGGRPAARPGDQRSDLSRACARSTMRRWSTCTTG